MSRHVPLDYDAVQFRADIETLRLLAARVWVLTAATTGTQQPHINIEQQTANATGIYPRLLTRQIDHWTTLGIDWWTA